MITPLTIETLNRSDVGSVRTARKPWRCTCADPVRRWEVHYSDQPNARTCSVYRNQAEAEARLGRILEEYGNGHIEEVPNPNYRPDCLVTISPGDRYFEDISDAEPYRHGPSYCARCAVAVWGKA